MNRKMPDKTNRMNNKVFLIALSPSSGIAFFESDGQIFEMDVSSGKIEELEEAGVLHSMLLEYGLQLVNRTFDTQGELKNYVKMEYLREKKDSYYMLLLTRELNDTLRREIIHLLDSKDFVSIDFSSPMVKNLTLQVREHPRLFKKLLQEVDEIQAKNVYHYLMQLWYGFSIPDEPKVAILKKEFVHFRDAFGGIEDNDNSTLVLRDCEIEYLLNSPFNDFANAFSM